MPNTYFQFKQFRVEQDLAAMKVSTDACILGAWAAKLIQQRNTPTTSVLDIGTGTGLLTLMLAQNIFADTSQVNNDTRITAIELDDLAYQNAKGNIAATPWANQITLLKDDARTFGGVQFDILIANPPFFQASLKPTAKGRSTALHADTLSLSDLALCLNRNAMVNSTVFILLPPAEMDILRKLLPAEFCLMTLLQVRNSNDGQVIRHYAHWVRHAEVQDQQPLISTETIKVLGSLHPQQYSDWFADLLAPYYQQL